MTTNDLKQISQLLDKRFETSEGKLGKMMDQQIAASEKRLMSDIGDFISENLLPQLDEKADKADVARLEANMERVERKLDNYSA